MDFADASLSDAAFTARLTALKAAALERLGDDMPPAKSLQARCLQQAERERIRTFLQGLGGHAEGATDGAEGSFDESDVNDAATGDGDAEELADIANPFADAID